MKVRNDNPGVRRLASVLTLAACLLVTSVVLAGPVDATPASGSVSAAQEPCGEDPYPPCPPPPPPTPVCIIESLTAVVGGTVTVRVNNLPVGTAVQLLLGTTVVAEGTVPAPSGAVANIMFAQAPVVYGNIVLSFVVAANLPPGSYSIAALVGGTLRLECGLLTVTELVETTDRSRGGLASTGAAIAAMVALALLLLAIGYGLVRRSRIRRHTASEAERILARSGWVRETVDH